MVSRAPTADPASSGMSHRHCRWGSSWIAEGHSCSQAICNASEAKYPRTEPSAQTRVAPIGVLSKDGVTDLVGCLAMRLALQRTAITGALRGQFSTNHSGAGIDLSVQVKSRSWLRSRLLVCPGVADAAESPPDQRMVDRADATESLADGMTGDHSHLCLALGGFLMIDHVNFTCVRIAGLQLASCAC